MKISLIVPTRQREKMFREFMSSVREMTKKKENIDLHFICDDDDVISLSYTKEVMKENPDFETHLHLVQRKNDALTFNINEDYYNMAAKKCNGDLIWILADDLEILTPGYDVEIIQEAINFTVKFPDKIFCISLRDNTPPPSHKLPKFPCFPLFTKECIPALGGWVLYPRVKTWGADYVTYCIFYPLDRLLQLHKKVYLNHKSWHTKQIKPDKTNQWIGHVFNQTKRIPVHNTDRIIDIDLPVVRARLLGAFKDWREKQGAK